MARTVLNTQLTPGNVFFVRGQVGFSRITRHTTDEERAKDNLRRTHKVDRNYTTISIYNAQVICKVPGHPTLEETYGAESCYNSSRAADYPGLNYSAMNKSQFLPKVGVIAKNCDPSKPTYDEIQLDGELAKGTDVTLVLRVFQGQGNNGVSLDTVLINNHDFQYYGNNANVANALADYGVTFNAMAPEDKKPTAEEMANKFGQGAPQATEQAPANNAFGQQTAPANNAFGQQTAPVNNAFGQQAAPQSEAPQATPNPFNSFGAVPAGAAPEQSQQSVQFGVGPGRTY